MVHIDPKEEANLIAYIVFFDFCKVKCRKKIGTIIDKYGNRTRKVVYRGHSKSASRIHRKGYSFLSTSPSKAMAELFVERDWSKPEEKQRVGHLFKIHLMGIPKLSTRNVGYTLSPEVLKELERIVKGRSILKGSGTYSFKQYVPKLRHTLKDLVFTNTKGTSEEWLVPTTGVFYKDSNKNEKGFRSIGNGDFETWYFPA